jgi:hypothetical protein
LFFIRFLLYNLKINLFLFLFFYLKVNTVRNIYRRFIFRSSSYRRRQQQIQQQKQQQKEMKRHSLQIKNNKSKSFYFKSGKSFKKKYKEKARAQSFVQPNISHLAHQHMSSNLNSPIDSSPILTKFNRRSMVTTSIKIKSNVMSANSPSRIHSNNQTLKEAVDYYKNKGIISTSGTTRLMSPPRNLLPITNQTSSSSSILHPHFTFKQHLKETLLSNEMNDNKKLKISLKDSEC